MLTLLTSGTTGKQKIVYHNWHNIEKHAYYSLYKYGIHQHSVILNMYPNSSIAHYTLTSYPAILAKATLSNFVWNPYNFKNAIDIKPTHIGCTPKQIEILSKTKAWKSINLKNVKIIIGGEKVNQELIKMLNDKGCRVYVTYGSTEFPPAYMTGFNSEWLVLNNRSTFIDNELHIDNIPTGDLFEVVNNKCRFIKRKVESKNITWKNKL